MSKLSPILLLGVCASLLAQDPPTGKPPAEEYADRAAKVDGALADEHSSVGAYLTGAQMHDWARIEYNNARRFVANHEKANKGLGYTVFNEETKAWESDPGKVPPTGNKKKGEDAAKVWTEYQKKMEALGKKNGRMFYELGAWCAKSLPSDKDKAQAAFKRALQYDPLNKDARTKLCHEKQKDGGFWLSGISDPPGGGTMPATSGLNVFSIASTR
jgi:hypothetical protein